MREQRKAERMNILGIDMDSVRVDRAIGLTSHYLEKNKFEYIAFVNTPAALAGHDQEAFVSFMNDAVLVLPGDHNMEEAVGVSHWKTDGEETYQYEFFRKFMGRMNRQRASIYLIIQKEEELEQLKRILGERYEKIHLEYSLWQEESNIDSMVNDINILAPDILLICGEYGRICEFMREHGFKINAGLCFCMDKIVAGEEMAVPEWTERFHLQDLYRWLHKKPLRFWHDTLFKRTMKKTSQEQAEEPKESEESVQDDENF